MTRRAPIRRRATGGGSVLSVERRACAYWSGDLRTFSTRSWNEQAGIVAIGIAADGEGRAWINPRFVPRELERMVRLRLQWTARYEPFTVLKVSDLVALAFDQEAEAGC